MKRIFYIFVLSFLMKSFSYGQTPQLINYPLVKGFYKSAVIDSTILYCLTDYGLMIWNVSNLQSPQFLGKLPAPGFFSYGKIIKYNDYVFLQRPDTTIIVDISNPVNPNYVTTTLSFNFTNDIAIKGSILYTVSNNVIGFNGYDISDIHYPTLIYSCPLPFPNQINISDTNLFIFSNVSLFRFNISNSLPVLTDSIVLNPNYSLLSGQANNRTAILVIGDQLNFHTPVGAFVYDISVAGNPILVDSTSISILNFNSLLGITDSLLFIKNDSILIYDITNPINSIVSDTLNRNYFPDAITIFDSLLFIINGSHGFDVYRKDGLFSYSLASQCNVGDWFTSVQLSSNGDLFVRGNDSMYVFNKSRLTSEIFSDYAFREVADEYAVIDSFLVETEIDGIGSLRISSINNFPTRDSIITVYGPGNAYLNYLSIWDQKLYNYHYGTEIYDLSNLSNPVLLANNIPLVYNHYKGGVLFDLATILNEVNLYDPSFMPPQFIKLAAVGDTNCPPDALWDPQRRIGHFWCPMSGEFYQLDYSDTSNIFYTNKVQTIFGGWNPSKVWNSIWYLTSQQSILIFDVCDINHFRAISQFHSKEIIQSIILTDSVLFIVYPGFVASYDVSHILPCLFTGLKQNIVDDNLMLFPNPSTGKFDVHFKCLTNEFQLTINDIFGHVINSRKVVGHKGQTMKIEFDLDISQGVYFLSMTGDKHTSVKKIIIY